MTTMRLTSRSSNFSLNSFSATATLSKDGTTTMNSRQDYDVSPKPFGNTMAARSFVRNSHQPTNPNILPSSSSSSSSTVLLRGRNSPIGPTRGGVRSMGRTFYPGVTASSSPIGGSEGGSGGSGSYNPEVAIITTFQSRSDQHPTVSDPTSLPVVCSSSNSNIDDEKPIVWTRPISWQQQRFDRRKHDRIVQKRRRDSVTRPGGAGSFASAAVPSSRLPNLHVLKEAAKRVLLRKGGTTTAQRTSLVDKAVVRPLLPVELARSGDHNEDISKAGPDKDAETMHTAATKIQGFVRNHLYKMMEQKEQEISHHQYHQQQQQQQQQQQLGTELLALDHASEQGTAFLPCRALSSPPPSHRSSYHQPSSARGDHVIPTKDPAPSSVGAQEHRPLPQPRLERQYSEITMSDFSDSLHSLHSLNTHGSSTCSFSHSVVSSSLPKSTSRSQPVASNLPRQRSRRWRAVLHHTLNQQEKYQQAAMMPPRRRRPSMCTSDTKSRSSFDSLDEDIRSLELPERGGGAETETIVSMTDDEEHYDSAIHHHTTRVVVEEEGGGENEADGGKVPTDDGDADDRCGYDDDAAAHNQAALTAAIPQDPSPIISLSSRIHNLRPQQLMADETTNNAGDTVLQAPEREAPDEVGPVRPAMMPDPRSSRPNSSNSDRGQSNLNSTSNEYTHSRNRIFDSGREPGVWDGLTTSTASFRPTLHQLLEEPEQSAYSERTRRTTDDIRFTTSSGHSSFSSFFDSSTIATSCDEFGSVNNTIRHNQSTNNDNNNNCVGKVDSPIRRPMRRLSPALSNCSFGSCDSGRTSLPTYDKYRRQYHHIGTNFPDLHMSSAGASGFDSKKICQQRLLHNDKVVGGRH